MKFKNYLNEAIDRAIYPIYGEEKSPIYLKLLKELLNSKTSNDIRKVMNKMVKKNIGFWHEMEFYDLIYKLDTKIEKLKLSGEIQIPNNFKPTGIEKYPNKIKMKF